MGRPKNREVHGLSQNSNAGFITAQTLAVLCFAFGIAVGSVGGWYACERVNECGKVSK
jgi:uncharacterized membrane protein YiaA